MNKITDRAKERCSHKSLQEQLEDCRRQMQRECGSGDMSDVTSHLNHDTAKLTDRYMPVDGAD